MAELQRLLIAESGGQYKILDSKPFTVSARYGGAAGLSHTSLITTGAAVLGGDVWVWGFRGSAQQGNGIKVVANNALPAKVQSLNNVVQLTGGAYHLIALDEWGQSGYGETGSHWTGTAGRT